MWSKKVKHFSFAIFYDLSKPYEKERNYIVAIIKVYIQNRNGFMLGNGETIVHKN